MGDPLVSLKFPLYKVGPSLTLKLGSQYDDRSLFRSFCIVPFGRLMFELLTNYRSLVPFPSL